MELNKIQRIRDAMKGRHYANLVIRNNGKDIVIEVDDLLDILPIESQCCDCKNMTPNWIGEVGWYCPCHCHITDDLPVQGILK